METRKARVKGRETMAWKNPDKPSAPTEKWDRNYTPSRETSPRTKVTGVVEARKKKNTDGSKPL